MKHSLLKRVLSLLLIISLFMPLLPNVSLFYIKAQSIHALTDSQITKIVEDYISVVGNNRYWNAGYLKDSLISQVNKGDYISATTSTQCSTIGSHIRDNGCKSNRFTGVSGGISQCWGFGDYIEYVIFGTTDGSNWNKNSKVDNDFEFRPGDLIKSTKNSSTQHIVVVYKVENSCVHIIEANYGGKCKINTRILENPHSYVNASNSFVLSPPETLRTSDLNQTVSKNNKKISANEIPVPITKSKGTPYEFFSGSISANNGIAYTAAFVSDSNGTLVKANVKSFAGSGNPVSITAADAFNSLIDFSTLSSGEYTLTLYATCKFKSGNGLFGWISDLFSIPENFLRIYSGKFTVPGSTRSTYNVTSRSASSRRTGTDKYGNTYYLYSTNLTEDSQYDKNSSYSIGTYKITASSGLNTRSKPSATSSRLSGWPYGTEVNVTATDGNWGYTSRGWICLDYAKLVSGSQTSYDSNISYDVGNYIVSTPSGLNCRKGVGTNYGIKTTLANGTQFSVTETDGAWGYSPDYSGWLCLNYATYVSPLTPKLPVPTLPNLSTTTSSEIGVDEIISFKWDAVDTAETYTVKLIDASTNKEVETKTTSGTNESFKAPYAGKFNVSVSASNSQHTGPEATIYGFTAKAPSTVTFKDWNGKVISTQEVAYGKDATAPTAPSRVGHTFAKWDGTYTSVRENKVVTATYTKNKYKVTFCDYDGAVISTQNVYYGDAATAPEYTAPTGYSFVKWDTSFDNITKETTVKAIISWTSLYPLEISTSSAVERNNKSYIVASIVNNSPNAVNNARVMAVLKTKENKLLATVQSENISLAKGDVKNLTLTASYEGMASKAEIFVVKADDENIPLAKQLEKTVDQGTAWSAWSTSAPPADALQTQSRTEYRYRDKDLKTSSSSSLSGYTQYDHSYTWSGWSGWSAWQDTPVSSNLSENVEQQVNVRTQSVDNYNSPITETRYSYKTVYHYFRYSTKYEGPKDSGYTYGSYTYQASGTQYYEYTSDTEYTRNSTYDQSGLKAYNRYYNSTNYNTVWACTPYTTQEVASSWQETVGYNKKTQYSYQTRNKNHTYYFYKWGDWSSWNPEVVNGTDSREVETRTTYRYLANTANNIETTAGNFVERNGTVDKSYANRQSLLFVMDKNGTTQFVGQTVVGADGSYAFKFKTKDEPTVTSGDYKVMLSIEGTSAAFELEPIKAPVPEYTVKFVDYDGTVVSEQTVEQGKDAVVPAPLSREGYRFIGWDKSFTNIQNDLIVTAQYEIKSFDVVFIDEINNTTMLERYNYGDTIVVPVIAENEKYNFLGWDAVLDGNTIVKDNIVVTAKYELKKFTVEVLGFDGEVIQSQIIDFGEPVVLPELKSRDNYIFVSWNVPGDINYVTENITVTPYFEYTNTVATPTSSIETGTYEGDQLVTLSCETEGADIYYTLDGSDPLQEIENTKARSVQINGMLYTGPFKLDSSVNLIYAAVKDGMNSSNYDYKTLAVNTTDSEIKQYTVTINYGIYDTMDTKLINAGEKVVLDDYELYNYGYTLIGVYTDEAMTKAWNLEKDTVNGETTLYLKWSQDSYTVTFKDFKDNVIEEQEVLYGEDAVAPMWNGVEGYIFTGWDTEYTNVVSNIEVKATYVSVDDITSVEFNKETLSIVEGQSDTISATVKLGADSENDALIWQSSDENVAIVDDNGKITAVAAGAATIFAVSEDSGMSAQCEVTVNYKDPCSVLGHKHEGKVTAPTCTEKGYTTYICSVCGDTYTANEKASLGHNMSEIITIVAPSCENEGQDMIKCSRCDYSEIHQTEAMGHYDNDGNNACDDCGKELSASSKCSCNCHKTGFMGIIWKILKFFYKLFKINPICECGVAHY